MRVQHINHALNPGKCFIFTDFVQCTYFELQQGNSVTARSCHYVNEPIVTFSVSSTLSAISKGKIT